MGKEIQWDAYLSPGASTTLWQQMGLVMRLSVPAILAEISAIAMQYIDSAMVGSLGASATAAIGLVSSTTWLFGGMCVALITGFSVQIAQLIGGGRRDEVQSVLRQGLMDANLEQYGRVLQSADSSEPDFSPRYLRERMHLLADPWGWEKRQRRPVPHRRLSGA